MEHILHIHKVKYYQNMRGAFKNLLSAQRGKGINEECYQMLDYNADKLIDKLK